MSKRDIESYTVNELGLMAVKQLKRIADAIEAQTAAVMSAKPTVGPDVSKEAVKIDLTALRSGEKAPPGLTVEDEKKMDEFFKGEELPAKKGKGKK